MPMRFAACPQPRLILPPRLLTWTGTWRRRQFTAGLD